MLPAWPPQPLLAPAP